MSKMKFIIAGYERGGTTLMSELFRANGFESGFECGVLLSNSPSKMHELKPYWENLLSGWNIDADTRAKAAVGDFESFYKTITTKAFPDHYENFFDKTPKYMECLGSCLHKADFIKGAVVIHRDPRAVFVSMAKRLSPDLDIVSGVEKNFNILKNRYLNYFIGSIGHISNDKVLFVPFEELVSREHVWLKAIGYFAIGSKFHQRTEKSRFLNVSLNTMDLSKVIEFDRLLPKPLQAKILDATQIASLFFSDPVERSLHSGKWSEIIENSRTRLQNFELPDTGLIIDDVYFEPLTYLIRYPDVLKSGLNPVIHFKKFGKKENRRPH